MNQLPFFTIEGTHPIILNGSYDIVYSTLNQAVFAAPSELLYTETDFWRHFIVGHAIDTGKPVECGIQNPAMLCLGMMPFPCDILVCRRESFEDGSALEGVELSEEQWHLVFAAPVFGGLVAITIPK